MKMPDNLLQFGGILKTLNEKITSLVIQNVLFSFNIIPEKHS